MNTNRRRGHDTERAVARWLRSHGHPDAATTRARLGHDGTHTPGDIAGVPGLVIEVKDVARAAWPAWCRQAAIEANETPWVVVRRTRGQPDIAEWECVASATAATSDKPWTPARQPGTVRGRFGWLFDEALA